MRQLARHFGDEVVVSVQVAAVVGQGMQYFAPNRRMGQEQVALWAEEVAAQFPHESLADINVFMRAAAMSKYDDGEFYSNVDIPRLNKWWAKYLDEKAGQMEITADRQEHELEQGIKKMIANVPGLSKAVGSFTIQERERQQAEREMARLRTLQNHIPRMSEQELRDAWPLYPGAAERALINAEAARRGLYGEELQAAQLQIDEQEAAKTQPAA